jgi:hypothetical protein
VPDCSEYPCKIKSNLSGGSLTVRQIRAYGELLSTSPPSFSLSLSPLCTHTHCPSRLSTPSHTPLFSFNPSGQASVRFSSSRYVRSRSFNHKHTPLHKGPSFTWYLVHLPHIASHMAIVRSRPLTTVHLRSCKGKFRALSLLSLSRGRLKTIKEAWHSFLSHSIPTVDLRSPQHNSTQHTRTDFA